MLKKSVLQKLNCCEPFSPRQPANEQLHGRASIQGYEARTAVEMFYSSHVGRMVVSGVTDVHSCLAACISKAAPLIPANPSAILTHTLIA